MKIYQVYQKFQIPQNLQEHMLRVGALAEVITDSWQGEGIDGEAVVVACLLHDVAKPMTFELERQAEFGMGEEEIRQLADLQKRLRSDYGNDEHAAVMQICRKLECSSAVVYFVEQMEWENLPRLISDDQTQATLAIYCDMRIGPQGILALENRVTELGQRTGAQEMGELERVALDFEEWLQQQIALDL